MKKIFLSLFLAVIAVTLHSCSDDEPQLGGTVSFTVDGSQKTYTNPMVTILEPNPEENGIVLLRLTSGTNDTGILQFEIEREVTGNVVPYFFGYLTSNTYHFLEEEFTLIISANENGHMAGTFSGRLKKADDIPEGQEFIDISNGSFDVRY